MDRLEYAHSFCDEMFSKLVWLLRGGSQRIQLHIILLLAAITHSMFGLTLAVAADLVPSERQRLIQQSYQQQRALFQNVRFKARYVQRAVSALKATTPDAFPQTVEDTAKRTLHMQDYQINVNGHFKYMSGELMFDRNAREIPRGDFDATLAFDGVNYRHLAQRHPDRPGLGSIFLPGMPYDYSAPAIKPTFFMDHLFNYKLKDMVDGGEGVTISDTDMGTWELKWDDSSTKGTYRVELDPAQGFMAVRMRGPWNDGVEFEKRMEYEKTNEGFYYVKKGTLKIGDNEPTVLLVDECILNGHEDGYTIAFPKGTRVTDLTSPITSLYYEGEPGRAEKGQSIYPEVRKLSQLELASLDEVVEKLLSQANLPPQSQPAGESADDAAIIERPLAVAESNEPVGRNGLRNVMPVVIVVLILLVIVGAYVYALRRKVPR